MSIVLCKLAMLEKSLEEREKYAKFNGYELSLEEKSMKQHVTNVLSRIR